MKTTNEVDQMNFTRKEWTIGIIESITKMLLAILVYMGAQLMSDVKTVQMQNAQLLNKLTELSTKQVNLTEQMHTHETQIEKLRDHMYHIKDVSQP